ncbi:hypothetical protein AOQ84DRAFT_356166 [Glonium stellatum]|uniref:Fucosyltransferase n=1 Tax=Glonium stellatum TaxID=574774 RepID=A0A8E2EU80_9PEZI|nr:hypothetical protein AOQ84DRAFT_356166 [Glonium stellatum]
MIINASHHAKTMHARRNPNLSVSSAASASLAPSSLSSASFLSPRVGSHRALLSPSPPPSPSLPSLIPRHGKKASSSHSRLVRRLLIAFCGVTIIVWLGVRRLLTTESYYPSEYSGGSGGEDYEMVEDSFLPQDPSAVIVTDEKGKSKWTISIPSSYGFPLQPSQYQEICSQSMELSRQLSETGKTLSKRMRGYYQEDPWFLDVQEAEEQGLLPSSQPSGKPDALVDDVAMTEDQSRGGDGMMVCEKSLTYVMETSDAGFGKSLMGLWMSYGLARKEGRAFFVDDARWPYGNYSTYFARPPSPGCLPPPKSQILPCPHTARHIVVSTATTSHTFGHAFVEEFEDGRKMRVQRQHNIFALLREGYESLFTLRSDDAKYVTERADALYGPITEAGGMSVGMHIRRGDRHPYEYQYSKDYLPLDRYIDTAREILVAHFENSTKSRKSKSKTRALSSLAEDLAGEMASKLVLASDDPDVYTNPEMSQVLRAQDRIILASKTTLEAATPKKHRYIDEISGWEGGFFRDVFWSLGQPVSTANAALETSKEITQEVSEQAMRLRELVGRAYLMDLAVLAKADAVVCTVSSVGCRILAVMVGWESAIDGGNWKNVDGDFDWRGIQW